MGIFESILEPFRVYSQRRKIEESLKVRETIDSDIVKAEQMELVTERDLDRILREYIDNRKAKSIDIVFPKEYTELAVEYLQRQQITFTVVNNERIVVRSE